MKHSGTIKASVPAGNPLKGKMPKKMPSGPAAVKRAVSYETRKKHRTERMMT